MKSTLHIIWGREAVNRYKLGQLDNNFRHSYNSYDLKTPELAQAFILGVRAAKDPSEWALVTNLSDIRKLGTPIRVRLIDAARRGDLATIKSMLDSGVKLDSCDENGMSALHHAAQTGQADIIHVLVDAGLEIDAPTTSGNGKTALHYASESDLPGTALAVKVLLELGADPNARDASGNTALHKTVLSSEKETNLVEKKAYSLAKAGADPQAVNKAGVTVLDLIEAIYSILPGTSTRVLEILNNAQKSNNSSELARLAIVKRMAPGTRQDLIRPNSLG